jgi:hypothetical protein
MGEGDVRTGRGRRAGIMSVSVSPEKRSEVEDDEETMEIEDDDWGIDVYPGGGR